jgi:hypothetical protein
MILNGAMLSARGTPGGMRNLRVVLMVIVHALVGKRPSPRLEGGLALGIEDEIEKTVQVIGLPNSGEIRLTVRSLRRGSREVRFPVGRPRSRSVGDLQPLPGAWFSCLLGF